MSEPFSVGLVVIARDAEGTIGRLIGSCRPWIESVLVLDTGSQDETEAVARSLGARVERMDWHDDFSAARNAALSLAAADWHLVLDSDEWLVEGGEFLLTLRGARPDYVGQVHLFDHFGGQDTNPETSHHWISRLLPGHVRYQGRVHEQPVHLLPVLRTPLSVGHDGYLPAELAKKRGRNRRLLEAALLDDPGDPYLMYQLGKDANVYQEHEIADRWLQAALSRADAQAPWRMDLVVRLLETLTRLGRFQEGSRVAEEQAMACSESPDFHFAVGNLWLASTAADPQGATTLLERAERSWRQCLFLGERPHISGAVQGRGSHLAAFNLALVLEGTGRPEDASTLRRQYGLSDRALLG